MKTFNIEFDKRMIPALGLKPVKTIRISSRGLRDASQIIESHGFIAVNNIDPLSCRLYKLDGLYWNFLGWHSDGEEIIMIENVLD
jgi:hypothetical protein